MQLLFGHEPAPIEGEAFDDEQQNRSITVSMAERLARQQSAMKAWLQAEAESRVERAQNRRTRVVQHWPSGPRVCYWRADVPSMGSWPSIRQGSTAILHKHKGAWLGPATVLAQEMGRSQEQHEEAHGTVWIVVQGRFFCDVHLNTCVISANVKVCRSTETRETRKKLERSLILFRISVSRKAHTLIFEVSITLLTDIVMRTETRPVVEPTVTPSATNLENPMSATHDSSEPTPFPRTDETQDRESPDMETDDPDTTATVSEPLPVSQPVPPSPLP